MKKILIGLTLSVTIITGIFFTHSLNTNKIILHVQSCNYDTNCNYYISKVMDENGELYAIESYDNISGQWLNATINKDGEITGYTIMN